MNSLKNKEKNKKKLKYAELKTSCICIAVNENYERNDFDKTYEVLSE